MKTTLPNHFVWRAALFASLGSALSGYYDGSMNGVLEMKGFQDTFHSLYSSHGESAIGSLPSPNDTDDTANSTGTLNDTHTCSSGNGAGSDIVVGLMVSTSYLGSVGGSLLAGWLSDKFGRKCGLLLSGLVIMAGSIVLAASFHVWTFLIGRGLAGVGVGVIYMVMPVYISEVSPKDSRGMLTSLIGPGYALGILAGLCTNLGFSRFHLGWRVAMCVQALIAFFFFLGTRWIPHTPRWLVFQHREKEARSILAKINHSSKKNEMVDTFVEMEELCAATRQLECMAMCRDLCRCKYLGRMFLVALLFVIFTAIGNFIYFYSSTLFCEVGVSPFLTALVVGLIILLASIMLLFFIDKVGRKAVLLLGSSANLVLATLIASLLLVYGGSNTSVTISVVAFICIYAFATSLSWLTVPWLVNSEVFPVNVRGLAVAISTGSYWLFSFFIGQLFPLVLGSTIGVHGFFYIMAGINLLSIFYIMLALPETKGVSLEQMDALFAQGCLKSSLCSSSHPEASKCSQSKELGHSMMRGDGSNSTHAGMLKQTLQASNSMQK